MLALKKVPIVLSNSVNTDTGGAKENVQIKWVDLTDKDFLYPGTKQTVRTFSRDKVRRINKMITKEKNALTFHSLN